MHSRNRKFDFRRSFKYAGCMEYDLRVRNEKETLATQRRMIDEDGLANIVSEYSEDFVGILNLNRQFVYVSRNLAESAAAIEEIIGKRPGEAVGCVHSGDTAYGCGTGEACGYCDALQTVLEVIRTSLKTTRESRLLVNSGGYTTALDVRVTGIPLLIRNNMFIALMMKDISRDRMLELLERAFFHDVLNSMNALSSLISISSVSSELIPDADKTLETGISDIFEQIHYYKKLKAAEEGEVSINLSETDPAEEILEIVRTVETTPYARGKTIKLETPRTMTWISTDRMLFKRIVFNLLKNALEACSSGDEVKISLSGDTAAVICEVKNPQVMTSDVRNQIFKRSFSTKGSGRGMGTYGSKVLAERYLGGDLSFSSSEPNGTVFRLMVPSL